MLNMIFGISNGKNFKLSWVPVIFFVATEGTIFNWANIVSNSLSSCISESLRGVLQKKLKFYMISILIDCILCTQSFPSLKCQWDKAKSPVYVAYQLLWAHNYFNHNKSIFEYFIMPLYRLMFLAECDCMSEEALKVVQDNGHYYLTEEGLYLRMFSGSRAPSLMQKYATDYVIHKEVVRHCTLMDLVTSCLNRRRLCIPQSHFI